VESVYEFKITAKNLNSSQVEQKARQAEKINSIIL
jgi:hypothetical protein